MQVAAFTNKNEDTVADRKGDDEEEIMLVESWPHIQIVYELLLRVIILKQYDQKVMV